MRRAWLPLALCGLLLAAACSGATNNNQQQSSSGYTHLQIAPTLHSYHLPGSATLVASIVQAAPDQYYLCDYFDVFRLTRTSSGYAIARLQRPPLSVWSPAGLAYRDGLLYVADNLGADVVVTRVTGDSLVVAQRITNAAMKTPQNVVAEPDGSVVVADYDGKGVLKFRADGSLQWRLPLGHAHGVAESGGFVYASSTDGGHIDKIDSAGGVVRVAGATGASAGRYVFPVSLAADNGRILVTDSVNGRITILDQNLKVVGATGANGPGMDALNYPYATLPIDGGYLIADTYKERLVVTDRQWVIREQVAFGPQVPTGRQRPLVFATDQLPTSYAMIPGVDAVGELGLRPPLSFVGGYNGIDHVEKAGRIHLDFGDSQQPIMFVTWAQAIGTTVVVGSPQSSTLEVIDGATGMFTRVSVGLDTWWHAGTVLYSANLRRNLSDVIAPAVAAFAATRQLLAQGRSRQDAFNEALNGGRPRDWSKDLTSPQAQAFLHSGMTQTDASKYFAWALQQPTERVVELLEVKYLSGS